MNEIFLSYKRSDTPGYVGRLADSMERAFGAGTVYRDVDSEQAGGNWKKSIVRSVSGAEVVLAVIGPSWQKLLTSGPSEDLDWVRYELIQAHDLGVPVIPVMLAQIEFDHKLDLGDLAWIKDLQFFELADGQGRWETDIARLAKQVENLTQLKTCETEETNTGQHIKKTSGDQSPIVDSGGGSVVMKFDNK